MPPASHLAVCTEEDVYRRWSYMNRVEKAKQNSYRKSAVTKIGAYCLVNYNYHVGNQGSNATTTPASPKYDLDNDATQAAAIPFVFGIMHANLYVLTVLPLSFCRGMWGVIANVFPTIRRHVPVDDAITLHRLCGILLIFGIVGAGVIWVLTMAVSCGSGNSRACLAFNPRFEVRKFLDPRVNVLFLRMLILPMAGTLGLLHWTGSRQPKRLPGRLKQHWFEICYFLHVTSASLIYAAALFARLEIFQYTLVGWGAYLLERVLSRVNSVCRGTGSLFSALIFTAAGSAAIGGPTLLEEPQANAFVFAGPWVAGGILGAFIWSFLPLEHGFKMQVVVGEHYKVSSKIHQDRNGRCGQMVVVLQAKDHIDQFGGGRFNRSFKAAAGRWVMVRIPSISSSWHPFSVANVDLSGGLVKLYVAVRGDKTQWKRKSVENYVTHSKREVWGQQRPTWTYSLMDKIRQSLSNPTSFDDAKIPAQILGPYGCKFTHWLGVVIYVSRPGKSLEKVLASLDPARQRRAADRWDGRGNEESTVMDMAIEPRWVQFDKEVGCGSCATVHEGWYGQPKRSFEGVLHAMGPRVAFKHVASDAQNLDQLANEERTLRFLQPKAGFDNAGSAYVIQLLGILSRRRAADNPCDMDGNKLDHCIMLEFAHRGSLLKVLSTSLWDTDTDTLRRLEILWRIAQGLRYIHARGVTHNDIKPGNIVIMDDWTPRIIDFGLSMRPAIESKTGGDSESKGDVQPSLKFGGTPSYMSPQRRRKELPTQADDVFALGRTIQLVLRMQGGPEAPPRSPASRPVRTGDSPFMPPGPEALPRPSSDAGNAVERQLIELSQRACAPDAKDRPAAAEIAEALHAMCVEHDLCDAGSDSGKGGARAAAVATSTIRPPFPRRDLHAWLSHKIVFGSIDDTDTHIKIVLRGVRATGHGKMTVAVTSGPGVAHTIATVVRSLGIEVCDIEFAADHSS
eukprot:g1098.t1